MPRAGRPTFFETPAAFRAWLRKHHATGRELLVGFHRKDSGRPSITWPEAVDEALCVGWIDGVRRTIDDTSYTIRFSPRRPRSIWSGINIRRAQELIEAGRMRPAGLKAFEARRENRSGIYSYEQRRDTIEEPYATRFRAHREAWAFFEAQSPSYRRKAGWWVVSARLETTRQARLEKLIAACARGRRLG